MQTVYQTKKIEIPSGQTVTVWPEGKGQNGDQYRFTAVGTGTVDIQPIIFGNSTHKAETLLNDTVVLDMFSVSNFELSASGGSATVLFKVLK